MQAEVISIGDELTSGQRLDTNTQWLSLRLGELGVATVRHTTVGDDLASNVDAFALAAQRANIVVATGGLGPTLDDLTRQAMAYAKQQPEAFSDRTGKPDVRSAYGLLGREVIQALKHLQHARGKTVIFVGVLEKVTDEYGVSSWVPQMEGSKAGRELPGIVDQVISMQLFGKDDEGAWKLDEKSAERRLVCTSGNPWGLPAKDRSGRLDMTEPPDLAALLAKIDGRTSPITPSV